jgi:hypothetical protein
MNELYYLICFPDIQRYQKYIGFDDHSYPSDNGSYFVQKEYADAVDNNQVELDDEYK